MPIFAAIPVDYFKVEEFVSLGTPFIDKYPKNTKTYKAMTTKMEDIIEFSELGKFIDRPVKSYSSGMYSKLAFSITAILETDIMLIDEVLSVGDAKFKKKSYAKMKELISNEDRTVLIVSHNSDTIKSLCNNVLWIHDGEMKMYGTTAEVLPKYDEFMK